MDNVWLCALIRHNRIVPPMNVPIFEYCHSHE
jgi:hypothetical protein